MGSGGTCGVQCLGCLGRLDWVQAWGVLRVYYPRVTLAGQLGLKRTGAKEVLEHSVPQWPWWDDCVVFRPSTVPCCIHLRWRSCSLCGPGVWGGLGQSQQASQSAWTLLPLTPSGWSRKVKNRACWHIQCQRKFQQFPTNLMNALDLVNRVSSLIVYFPFKLVHIFFSVPQGR